MKLVEVWRHYDFTLRIIDLVVKRLLNRLFTWTIWHFNFMVFFDLSWCCLNSQTLITVLRHEQTIECIYWEGMHEIMALKLVQKVV
jgi:hypothetical protein